MNLATNSARLLLLFSLITLLGLRPGVAQKITQVSATNPKYPEYYPPPHQSQLKWLLQGAKADSQPEDRILISEAKMQTFSTNGETELLIQAPQCLYNRNAHSVSSPGPLHVQTGDGKYIMDGTGFLWLQTNSMLFISNQVHSFLQGDLLQAGPTARAGPPGAPAVGNIEVTSENFFFDRTNGIATYLGNAHVTGTNLSITGGSIIVLMPMPDRQLQTITIETNVVMDYQKIHITGERTVYSAKTGLARVTGQPRWREDQREGSADELIIDATNQVFRANGNALLKLPSQAAGKESLLPPQFATATNAAPVTNRWFDISSDYYEFHTNSAVFGDRVLVSEKADAEEKGTLACGLLNVRFAGTNELQSMVAEKNVLIRHETNRLSGDMAVYTGSTGNLELTGHPAWLAGPRQGKGERLTLNLNREEMLVQGDASMRLPARELGRTTSLASNQPLEAEEIEGTNSFADVFAEEYTVSSKTARFDRHVRILHPRMNWSCEKMTVDSAAENGKNFKMIANDSVVFVLNGEKSRGPIHGSCDRVEYVYNELVTPKIDRAEMTGHPVLETTNATIRNAIIILDQAHQQLITPGEYAMTGTARALGTNSFGAEKPRRSKTQAR